MKFILSTIFSCLFLLVAKPKPSEITLQGAIFDQSTRVVIPNAEITCFNVINQKTISTSTNVEGSFAIALEPGTYNLQINAPGYETIKIIQLQTSQINHNLYIPLKTSTDLETVKTVYFQPSIYSQAPTSAIDDADGTEPTKSSRTDSEVIETETIEVYAPETYEEVITTRMATPTKTGEDSKPEMREVAALGAAKTKKVAKELRTEMPPAEYGTPTATLPKIASDKSAIDKSTIEKSKSGLLTGGEWNDLHNWDAHWTQLYADGELNEHISRYGFHAKHRVAIRLQNEAGNPLINASVVLQDGASEPIWTARTDNAGKAELWYSLFHELPKDVLPTASLTVTTPDGKQHDLGKVQPNGSKYHTFTLKEPCVTPNQVDILWAIDATGSMGDEIDYLKAELLDVITQVKRRHTDLDFRMGSVFYRDTKDDYLVKSSKLHSDISRTVAFIQQQQAGGGGDYPEAVDAALEEAIAQQPWRDGALARLCFLLLDASPHNDPDVKERIRRLTTLAATKGIRIIPIACSGIEKDTEFLLKFIAMATNGTYLFLTDDSGIGGKHLAPTADEYKVEQLNQLLIRIISEYVATQTCDGKQAIVWEPRQNDPQQNEPSKTWKALLYPNPAKDFCNLELPTAVRSVTLYNAEGKAVLKKESPSEGLLRLDVAALPSGFYTIRILIDVDIVNAKLMIIGL